MFLIILIATRRAERVASLLCCVEKSSIQLQWRLTFDDSSFRRTAKALVVGLLRLTGDPSHSALLSFFAIQDSRSQYSNVRLMAS